MPTDPSTKPKAAASRGSALNAEWLFRSAATTAGGVIVAAIALIALFLLVRAVPSIQANEVGFFTSTEFNTSNAEHLRFGIKDLFMVTVLSSLMALVIAVPIGVGIALFLTQYAPKALARPFAVLVDLLAAVPSIVFGLWGFLVLAPKLEPVQRFLNDNLGWFFLFSDGNVSISGGGTIFTAGVVLAVMILPIITSVSREVFGLTPYAHIEAAQALGATKWEVVRMTVLPYGRSGVIAGSMLGLGRALGETIAVLVVLRTAAEAGNWSLFDGGYTFASKIASAAAEFSQPLPTGAYIAAGFVLFALTFVVNALARLAAGGKVNG
ncbi:phosphate ABC transporter permease subunit PstC [Nocardia otitidiscaviarum]|uniref:Phosphate transport system permease protein n=1 Tax=Nocardia otitidiscaviarum TaxID=1823 RepID=A0A378YI64_9NOCA|nr:phosphate ABC transporter permease subunit PstC [Nocardia otitidiscaviarum]MBF6134051.1 phosphate ABC transporter permease subunit PstC [Nocardia otitidiscaviarum]MBF6236031.1 phosphate ABC transporter permease subunit PstC [Nocardia otitidiscaviarum]MBF6484288.1 phosphate ABC transporter permease subunit PstC [Nocardia otitidiscaviarum]SUA76089.1 Phosphate transport system permease protein pstC [Nocardia otitidiscaviarum]